MGTKRRDPERGAAGLDRLARLVASADRLDVAVRALERAPGVRAAATAKLRQRHPRSDRPSPLSTAVLARLAARAGGDGLVAAMPFLADANPIVQVEVADALEGLDPAEVRRVVSRLAGEDPSAPFWEPLVDLLASWDDPGVGAILIDLAGRVRDPGAQAALLEALPFVAAPRDRAAARRAIERFAGDRRAVPGGDTREGHVTFAMLAADAIEALDAID